MSLYMVGSSTLYLVLALPTMLPCQNSRNQVSTRTSSTYPYPGTSNIRGSRLMVDAVSIMVSMVDAVSAIVFLVTLEDFTRSLPTNNNTNRVPDDFVYSLALLDKAKL